MLGNGHVRFGERAEETHRLERAAARLGPTPRRHEAPWIRAEMRGPAVGLSQQAGEAEGSLTVEMHGEGGSSPDNDGTAGTARRPGPGKQGEKV